MPWKQDHLATGDFLFACFLGDLIHVGQAPWNYVAKAGLECLILLPLLPGCWNGRSNIVCSMSGTGNGFLRGRTLHESTGVEEDTVEWLSPLRLLGANATPHLLALGQQCDSHSWNGPAKCLGQHTQP